MPKPSSPLPRFPGSATLHDLTEAAKILSERAGSGWSYHSLRRRIDTDWQQYEGRIWSNAAPRGARNRKIKICVEGVLQWLSLPESQR